MVQPRWLRQVAEPRLQSGSRTDLHMEDLYRSVCLFDDTLPAQNTTFLFLAVPQDLGGDLSSLTRD